MLAWLRLPIVLAPAVGTACRTSEVTPWSEELSRETPAGGTASAPAKQLALSLPDLPAGFRLAEELTPGSETANQDDPWGRQSAYSATFVPAGARGGAGISSSVNAYGSAGQAQSAFASWRAAVPRQYRPVTAEHVGAPETLAYLRESGCLVGFRVRNVMGSVLVSGDASHTTGDDTNAASLQAEATRLARLMVSRIEAGALPGSGRTR